MRGNVPALPRGPGSPQDLTRQGAELAAATIRADSGRHPLRLVPVRRPQRFSPSARTRILGWALVLLALALLLSTAATHIVLAQRQQQKTHEDLIHERDEFGSTLATQLAPEATPGRRVTVASVLTVVTARAVPERDVVFLGLLDGRVVASSAGPSPMDLTKAPQLLADWASVRVTSTGELTTSAGPMSYLAEPFLVPGDPHQGVFVAAFFTAHEGAALMRLTTLQIEIGALALILGGGAAWLIAGRVLRPVRQTTELARRITGSDLSERIPRVGRDEISDLADTFNTMLDRLQAVIERQKELLSDVSHELRTPITVVQGNLDTLEPATLEDADTIAIASDELTRMTRMVEDLLVLGRSEQPDFVRRRPVDVDDFVSDMTAKLRAMHPRRWVLDARAHGMAVLDRDLVTQAIMELGLNAIRHAPGDGPLQLRSRIEGDTLLLVVADRGPGIPDTDKPRVFNRFVRLDHRRASGSGLGLSIIRAVARAHGGDVTVRDGADGVGTRFELRLPVMAAPATRADTARAPSRGGAR